MPKPTMPPKPLWRVVLGHIAAQWNLLAMGALIALAYAFPRVGMTGGALRAEFTVTWGGVGLIFLIAGLSLSLDALKKGLPHIQAHAVCAGFTYLVAPALAYGFGTAGRDAGLDVFVMGGMVVTGGLPTTVASNVSATLATGGSTALASIEVLLSNTLGPFIAPLLAKMFLTPHMGWADARPGRGDLTPIYLRMAKQLSAALLGPMVRPPPV
jgi:sodium/bile acid cotransporter 7